MGSRAVLKASNDFRASRSAAAQENVLVAVVEASKEYECCKRRRKLPRKDANQPLVGGAIHRRGGYANQQPAGTHFAETFR
jgi:hypothetical protein